MTRMQQSIKRRAAPLWIVAGLVLGLGLALALSGIQSAGATGHITGNEHIVLSVNEVDFEPGKSRSTKEVWIRGSGFTKWREITILVTDGRGVLYEISTCRTDSIGLCEPRSRRDGGGVPWPLTVNEEGAFASSWRLGRFTRNNVGGEAMATVWAADTGTYEFLASAPLALCNFSNREEGEEVPDFCSA